MARTTASSPSSPVGALLSPAHHDEQGIVDRDAEADQSDQELDDHRDAGYRGHAPEDEEGGHDRDDGHEQRHEGQQRREHESQHDERPEPPEH
jgi:hypothetical protein